MGHCPKKQVMISTIWQYPVRITLLHARDKSYKVANGQPHECLELVNTLTFYNTVHGKKFKSIRSVL